MQEVVDELQLLFKQVSVKINKEPESFDLFIKILKQNWFDTRQSLMTVTDQQFLRMNIPIRVVNGIRQVLTENKNNNHNTNQNNNYLSEYDIQTMIMQMIKDLRQECDQNLQQVTQILIRLSKIIGNINKNPFQQKFRTLKKSNQLIFKTFWQHHSCMKFMTKLGFQNKSELLLLSNVNNVNNGVFFFIEQSLLATIRQYSEFSKQKNNKNNIHKKDNHFISFQQFPVNNQEQIKQAFSKDKLQNENYAQALQKLIQYRTQTMSNIPKSRKLKIYHKKYQQKNTLAQHFDLRTQLDQTTDIEVLKYWKNILETNQKGSQFQSRRKQQFQFLLKQKVYKQTCIKIKLPNQYIIEGYFGPLEKLKAVFDWLCDIVIGDMYLYTTPPVKKMVKQLQMTLDALDCVPNGTFYLGFKNEDYFIKKQYCSLIIN